MGAGVTVEFCCCDFIKQAAEGEPNYNWFNYQWRVTRLRLILLSLMALLLLVKHVCVVCLAADPGLFTL